MYICLYQHFQCLYIKKITTTTEKISKFTIDINQEFKSRVLHCLCNYLCLFKYHLFTVLYKQTSIQQIHGNAQISCFLSESKKSKQEFQKLNVIIKIIIHS